MKGLLLILLNVVVITSCKKSGDNISKIDTPKITTKNSADTGVYLALGDSYTIGQSVPANDSYPIQLSSELNNAGFAVSPTTIIAQTGWTTDNLIHAIAVSGITNNKYNIVTLLIGMNDQYQGLTQDHYRTNFIQLLHTAINFAKGDSTRVFVLSIPDYGVTPASFQPDSVIGPEIDAFNAINKQESSNAGVNYVDITGISREAANSPNLIAPDGLHPSGIMYAEWVEKLMPLVAARLNKN